MPPRRRFELRNDGEPDSRDFELHRARQPVGTDLLRLREAVLIGWPYAAVRAHRCLPVLFLEKLDCAARKVEVCARAELVFGNQRALWPVERLPVTRPRHVG